MDRHELLANMRTGREQLDAALARLEPSQMTEPILDAGWSVKDLLAHIGWWEQRIVNTYNTLLRDDIPDPALDAMPVDELNQMVYFEHASRSLRDVQRDERRAYDQLVSLAEHAPEADLFAPDRFAWTEGQPFVAWMSGNTYEHYAHHLPALQTVIDEKR
jgi:uncharacterized protein (TIGR03083 family)